jgi:1-aminocyclopropane-1-carboxylate deaminase/D-cysteine desulfhydrase-like pyridoxal-dependent ACC family enzyme
MTVALFDAYAGLAQSMPRIALCDLPTPIEKLQSVTGASAHIKKDGLSAPEFGGNKVRTLEFLLGAAAQGKVPRAYVVGLPGTSMALASAIYGKRERLNLAVVLLRQRATEDARRNLLVFQKLGTELYQAEAIASLRLCVARLTLTSLILHQRLPYVLNPNSPTGMTGYVNMAFELRDQIRQGQLPAPDRIYIPMGLQGTVTGLLLGLRAAGLKSRLVAVSVAPHDSRGVIKTKTAIVGNARKLNNFLRKRAPDFPQVSLEPGDFDIQCDAPKQEQPTLRDEGMEQMEAVWQKDGIRLDATWTASAWAAMQRDLKAGYTSKPLFWHTYNAQPLPVSIDDADHQKLPKVFHRYFGEPVTLINRPSLKKDYTNR